MIFKHKRNQSLAQKEKFPIGFQIAQPKKKKTKTKTKEHSYQGFLAFDTK
jgi:hypothetical protein